MKIAICDYSAVFLRAFRTELEKCGEASELWVFDDYDELLHSKFCCQWECVFMATEINGQSGIDAAMKLKMINRAIEVVFITENCEKYAQQIFTHSDVMRPFSLFVKPVSRSFMRRTLDMLKKAVAYHNSTGFTVRLTDSRIINVVSEDIQYVEHNNRISTLHTAKGNYYTRSVIPFFDEKLPAGQFIHAAKSLIVNLKFVDFIESGKIVLKDGTILFASRNYKQKFEKSYLECTSKSGMSAESVFI